MAENTEQTMSHETAMDYGQHRKTYENFLWLCKWTVILVVVTLVLMAIFLV